jgi:hypothetical protein
MMKRLFIGTVILLSAVLLFAQEGKDGEALIRECTGTVEIMMPGETTWKLAEPGQVIGGDTKISTGFKSTALIALGNSTLIVRPLTRLSLNEIVNIQGNETVSISLQTGRVRAEVKAPSGGATSFTVQSPMVTASVRGTSFDFDGTNLTVDEGRVHLSGGDGTGVYVGAGQRTVSSPQTGRTAGAGQTFRNSLTPTIPAADAAGAGTSSGPALAIPEPEPAAEPPDFNFVIEFAP